MVVVVDDDALPGAEADILGDVLEVDQARLQYGTSRDRGGMHVLVELPVLPPEGCHLRLWGVYDPGC